MMTIEQFCEKHDACKPGRDWAMANCKTMQEAWDRAPEPEWVVWIATRPGVLTERELRLFMCFCARQNWHMLTDPRSRNAVEVAERYANGQASQEELAAAWAAALEAWEAAWASRTAARTAARTAVAVAWVVAWTAWAVAREAREAAGGIAAIQQAAWLRKNTKPNFD